MYIIFQVLRFAQNLQRCARLSLFCRLSFCAPEPRDNALCTVCCMETIYVSLRDTTNRAFLFSRQLNLQTKLNRRKAPLFVCTKTGSLCVSAETERCASVTRFAVRQILAVLLDYAFSVVKATAKRKILKNFPKKLQEFAF